jgi:hypothetical protein
MAKFLIQDIMPPEKRRPTTPKEHPSEEVSAQHHVRHKTEEHVIHSDLESKTVIEETVRHEPTETERDSWSMQSGPARWGWSNKDFGFSSNGSGLGVVLKAVGACLVILLAYFGYATLTGKAEVVITPRMETIALDNTSTFKAVLEPTADELGYSVMRFSLTESMEVPATGSRVVTEKASGKIIIYNEFSTSPQRLIKNTRFESPTGKIYRINESVTIPGMKKDGNKVIPGSLEVTVYADEPGPAYNTEPTDFTIPGFKSDAARYKGFFARSKGPITGGASGTVKTVSDEDLKNAADKLRLALETKLRTKARGNLGKEQIMFDSGIVIEFADATLVASEGQREDQATIERTATLAAVVFDQRALAKHIASKRLGANYHGEPVKIENASDLIFSMEKTNPTTLFEKQSLDFGLTGTAKISWIIDPKEVAELLRGADERTFNEIMSKEEGSISKARMELRPFWRSTYPKDPNEIIVTIETAQ